MYLLLKIVNINLVFNNQITGRKLRQTIEKQYIYIYTLYTLRHFFDKRKQAVTTKKIDIKRNRYNDFTFGTSVAFEQQ